MKTAPHKGILGWVFLLGVVMAWGLQPGATQAQTVPVPSGIVGWWSGEGNATDIVGANNGTLNPGTSYGSGKVGQAFGFDSVTEGVLVGNPAVLQLQNLSIEMWVKRVEAAPGRATLEHPARSGELFGYGSGGYILVLLPDGQLGFGRDSYDEIRSGALRVTDTNWHHVALTKSGFMVSFFVDGNGPTTITTYNTPFVFNTQAAIGVGSSGNAQSFYGSIDEVSVYNRALSAAEIQAIAAAPGGKAVTYTITASAGANGSISPSGAVPVNKNASQTFTITPSAGYLIQDVVVDGSSVGAVSSYTFGNITANHTIAASFTTQFTEAGASTGLNEGGTGYGMAWGDYDGDGDQDIFIARPNGANSLYRNNGNGTFTEAHTAAGLVANTAASAGVWGDYDNDGNLDLYVANGPGNSALYRNNGSGVFTDVTSTAGVTNNGNANMATWVDYNNDGSLDLFVVNYDITERLYRNNGNGTFTDVASSAGLANVVPYTYDCTWGDYDNDGDQDVHIGSFGNDLNGLFRNDGGIFTDVTAATHARVTGAVLGGSWGDYDNDGDLDLFLGRETTSTVLLRNDGVAGFTQIVFNAGVSWSGGWGDYDNDGYLDLYSTARLFRNQGGTLTAVNIGVSGGLDNDRGGAAWADIDNDGDLDLYDVVHGGTNKFFRNNGTPNRWLQVKLVGTVSNKAAIGAQVTAIVGTVQRRQDVEGGSGLFGQSSLPVEFGLGSTTTVDQLTVRWPSGIVQTLNNVSTNQILTVTEPAAYTITASAGANGLISPSGAISVNQGASQTFAITPATGYHIADVVVDGVSVGVAGSYYFSNVTANHAISANFALNTYTLTATVGANGSISPSGPVSTAEGTNQTFTITPDPGYQTTSVVVDGNPVGLVSSYTFSNVTADHTIVANFVSTSYAFPIQVDPGAYAGFYKVDDRPLVSGASAVYLVAGEHVVNNGSESTFVISVDGSGNVTSLNPAAAQGIGSTLRFNTTTITVDPGSYSGNFTFMSYGQRVLVTGLQSYVVIPGLRYGIDNGTLVGASIFAIDVDASGNVTSRNPGAAHGSGSTLYFNNSTITVDPGSYTGNYTFISYGQRVLVAGLQSYVVIPGLRYGIDDGTLVGGSAFVFDVDASGNVTSQNPGAAHSSGSTLYFNNTTITVDPGSYTGKYTFISYGQRVLVTGLQSYVVIPGLRYGIDNGTLAGGSAFVFDVDASGNVISQNPGAAQGSGPTLVFGNTRIHVDPTTYTGPYTVLNFPAVSGPVNVVLVPNLLTATVVNGQMGTFTPQANSVSPSSVSLTVAGQTYTLLLSMAQHPPTANAGPNQTVEGTSSGGASVVLDGSGSSDPDGDPLNYSWSEGGNHIATGVRPTISLSKGSHTLSLVVNDGVEESAAHQVVIDVVDTTPPAIVLGGTNPTVLECPVEFVEKATVSDLSDLHPTLQVAGMVDSRTPGSYTLTYTATDANGNSATATRTVQVVDTTPPTIAAPTDLVVECSGPSGQVVVLETPVVSDACDVSPSVTSDAPALFLLGATMVTWTAKDAAGNSSTAQQTVTIADHTAPAVTAPVNVTAEATGLLTPIPVGTATATDAAGVVSLVSAAPVTFPVGTTTVTWTATDAAGNTGTALQTVTITDHSAPVVTAPAMVTAEATGAAGAAVTLPPPNATDNVGVVNFISNAPDTFPLGTTTVTWTAKDAAGNVGSAAQLVTVVDRTAPVVTAPQAITLEATGPLTTVVLGTATATDAVGVKGITNNAPAGFPLGTTTVTWTATDVAGNSSTATQLVAIADHTAPAVTAALTAISRNRDEDEDEDEDGNFYRITATAADLVDPRPVVSAQISQPLAASTSMTVVYKREDKNRIKIQVEKRQLKVTLSGPSEQSLRVLWGQVLSSGGFSVSNGQQVQLVLRKDKDQYEAQYRFDKTLKLTSANGPGLSLVVWARDLTGNQSPPAKAIPSKSGSAKVVSDGRVPTTFGLEPNYPNPFNPATTLRYNLVEAGPVRLTVYNVAGQRVRELVDQVQEAGGYQVEWDTRDQSGQLVAGGVYLYRLEAGVQCAVGRMLLLR
ncbi:MAG: VCBS repeat-containing protein [Candidatus Latescibacteria bacterium]|nr:VCBS repeat-containing protein [Candidatus Latescibacterota bacterium]